MNLIDAAEYKTLKHEFERLVPQLREKARQVSPEGAWARCMLILVPDFLRMLELERRMKLPSRDVLEGMSNMFADVIRNAVRVTMTPAERLNAFDALMRHIDQQVRPKLVKSDGGIILPGGWQ